MTDGERRPDDEASDPVPEAVVRERRGLPIVWLVPIVAALVAGWIWWRAIAERGPEIAIEFETAEGVEAGRTAIKFKQVEVGQVEEIEIKDDLSGVTMICRMDPEAEDFLRDATRFWVVRPRVGAGGVSGLSTIVSGAYIAVDPSLTGEPARRFVGLEHPPISPADMPGLRLTLIGESLGSLSVSSPVYYRQIEVGKVEAHRFSEDYDTVEIDVYVEPEFAPLVCERTRFWNAGGLEVGLDAGGVHVSLESLEALLLGGIAFDRMHGVEAGRPAASGDVYRLYADRAAARADLGDAREYILYFRESVRGLNVGAPVEFRGIPLGEVRSIGAEYDFEARQLRLPVRVAIAPERVAVAQGADDPVDRLDALVDAGLRARLEVGSLVTGALYVDLDFYPRTEARWMAADGDPPELPTIPSTAAGLAETLDELPLLVADLRAIVEAVESLVTSPELTAALTDLDDTVRGVHDLVGRVDEALPPLVGRLEAALDAAERTLASLDAGQAEARAALRGVAAELTDTLHSVRALADTLERQPEALLKGKSGP